MYLWQHHSPCGENNKFFRAILIQNAHLDICIVSDDDILRLYPEIVIVAAKVMSSQVSEDMIESMSMVIPLLVKK